LGLFCISILPYSPLFLEKNQIKCDRIEPTLIDCQLKKIRFFGLSQNTQNLSRITTDDQSLLKAYTSSEKQAQLENFLANPEQSQLNLSSWNYDFGWLSIWKNQNYLVFLSIPIFIFFSLANILFSINDLIVVVNKKDKSLSFIVKNCYKTNRNQYSLESVKEISYGENYQVKNNSITSPFYYLLLIFEEQNSLVIPSQLSIPSIPNSSQIQDFYFSLCHIQEVLSILSNFWEFKMKDNQTKFIQIFDNRFNKKYIIDQYKFCEYNWSNQEKNWEVNVNNILEIEPIYHTINDTDEDGKEIQREKYDHLIIKYQSDTEKDILSYSILRGLDDPISFFTTPLTSFIKNLQKFIIYAQKIN